MDTSVVIVLALGLVFVIGGPIVGPLASKASEKAEKEEINQNKNK